MIKLKFKQSYLIRKGSKQNNFYLMIMFKCIFLPVKRMFKIDIFYSKSLTFCAVKASLIDLDIQTL